MGKTTLINLLYKEFDGKVSTFSLDNYYLPKEKQIRDSNGIINFDLPSALDADRLANDIEHLLGWKYHCTACYGFNNPSHEKAVHI